MKKILPPIRKSGQRTIMLKLVRKNGQLMAKTKGLKFKTEDIAKAVREERDSR